METEIGREVVEFSLRSPELSCAPDFGRPISGHEIGPELRNEGHRLLFLSLVYWGEP